MCVCFRAQQVLCKNGLAIYFTLFHCGFYLSRACLLYNVEAKAGLADRLRHLDNLVTCTTDTGSINHELTVCLTLMWNNRNKFIQSPTANSHLFRHTATTLDPNQTPTNLHPPHLPLLRLHPYQYLPPLHLLAHRSQPRLHCFVQSKPPARLAVWRLC